MTAQRKSETSAKGRQKKPNNVTRPRPERACPGGFRLITHPTQGHCVKRVTRECDSATRVRDIGKRTPKKPNNVTRPRPERALGCGGRPRGRRRSGARRRWRMCGGARRWRQPLPARRSARKCVSIKAPAAVAHRRVPGWLIHRRRRHRGPRLRRHRRAQPHIRHLRRAARRDQSCFIVR